MARRKGRGTGRKQRVVRGVRHIGVGGGSRRGQPAGASPSPRTGRRQRIVSR